MAFECKLQDSYVIEDLANRLSTEKVKDELLDVAELLRQKTRETLIRKVPKSTHISGKRKRSMADSLFINKEKYNDGVLFHIMGDYRLRWFEKGTKQHYGGQKTVTYKKNSRITKKENKTGSTKLIKGMNPRHFFSDALSSVNLEAEIDNKLNNLIQ